MDFENFRNQMYEAQERKENFVATITPVRIELAKQGLAFLRGDDRLLRQVLFEDASLDVSDNRTKATYVAQHFVICLTQYYIISVGYSSKMTLPADVTNEILVQCETDITEVLALLEQAREIEIEELLNLGARSYAIERASCI